MSANNGLVLEIFEESEALKMSLFERNELASTVRHYSQCPVSFAEIDRLCREAVSVLNRTDERGALPAAGSDNLRKIGQLLWDHLFTGIVKEALKRSQTQDLILSIDEELISIPWEVLYDGRDFLCLKFNLGRVIRTKEQKNQAKYRSLGGKLKMLVLANPTGDLKSAYLEGVYIKNQFDRRRKDIGIDFKSSHINMMYVKKNMRDYDIVHFAGHCEYDRNNQKKTGWVLNDGILNVHDIHAMEQSQDLPSLVFSNACSSARSVKGLVEQECQEKAYSLASAFLFSGVRHYIGTIRKIDDEASLIFAKEFYAQLISGNPLGECIRLARLKLVKEYGMGSVSWAGYLLYGDPNFKFFFLPAKPQGYIRSKRSISSYKKGIARSFCAACFVAVCIYLYSFLPTINPNTYLLYIKSRSLLRQGRNQEAVLSGEQIIKKERLFLAVYPLLGDAYLRLGDRKNALKYYFEYALLSEKKRDKKNLADSYIGLGWVYHLYGDYNNALDFYNRAVKLAVGNKDKMSEAIALRKLAVWHIDKEENDRALELLTKSSEINRERQHIYGHKYNLACDYFNIGLVFANKLDYASAKDFYAKSRILFEKLKLKDELSDCYFNLGEICLFEKQYQKARDYYMEGLKIDSAQENKFKLAQDYNMLGELFVSMDDTAEAEKYFNQAKDAAQETDSPIELAGAYRNLGLLYKHRGQTNKARQYFRQAQDIYRLIDLSMYQKVKKDLLDLTGEDI